MSIDATNVGQLMNISPEWGILQMILPAKAVKAMIWKR
jgi:hypothetical protein